MPAYYLRETRGASANADLMDECGDPDRAPMPMRDSMRSAPCTYDEAKWYVIAFGDATGGDVPC